jgi:hypothetical protein
MNLKVEFFAGLQRVEGQRVEATDRRRLRSMVGGWRLEKKRLRLKARADKDRWRLEVRGKKQKELEMGGAKI